MGRLARRILKASKPGQAIVEMALITPILLMLMGGIIDFGIYMYREVQAASCVREVARRASVRADALPPAVPTTTYSKYCGTFVPTISPSTYKTAANGSAVVASVNVPHTWMIIGNFVPGMKNATIKAEAAMRLEGQQV